MFGISWPEFMILGVVGLVVLGPERLPGALHWTINALKQAREFATGASDQLKNDFGADLAEFREPIAQLNELRQMTPRAMITKHLFDGDSSFFTGDFTQANGSHPASAPGSDSGHPPPSLPRQQSELTPGERPPFDPDAT